jgi:hypothetical protein
MRTTAEAFRKSESWAISEIETMVPNTDPVDIKEIPSTLLDLDRVRIQTYSL